MFTENFLHILNTSLAVFIILCPVVYSLLLIYILRKDLRDSWLVILTFLILTGIFLNKLLFFNQSLAQQDFNNIQIPLFYFFRTSILKFLAPPLWNSSFCGGFDAFSNPLAGYLSFFNWVFLFSSDVYKSFNMFIFLQIFSCLISAYVMLKTFGFSKAVSFFGAIAYSFNGFVTMRLSPGVGLEYLFAYKWIPLILAFTKKYLDNRKGLDLLGLTIALAFSFEGNPNIVIASGVLWFIFLLVEYRKVILCRYKILIVPILSLFIYALKLFPVIDLISNKESRFSQSIGGWRASNFDIPMFPRAFLPLKFGFTNGVFTPGVLAVLFFLIGLTCALVIWRKTKKPVFEGFYFVLLIFIPAFFITIENPVYYFFYSLPILSMVTIIPSFLIMFIIPIVFFSAYGFSLLLKVLGKRFYLVAVAIIPTLVFLEVLVGPSTFGKNTYSFNFAKMNYVDEVSNFSHYNVLKEQKPGIFSVIDNPKLFIYPNSIAILNLSTLNNPNYFFGCNNSEALSNMSLEETKKRSDYILSMYPLADKDITLISKVDMNTILKLKSHAVFENVDKYLALYDTGWNDDMYIYSVGCIENCTLKNYSKNPTSFKVDVSSQNFSFDKTVSTSINYSKWLKAKSNGKYLSTSKDGLSYVSLRGDIGDSVSFYYINPYIYVGFVVSFIFLIVSVIIFFRLK